MKSCLRDLSANDGLLLGEIDRGHDRFGLLEQFIWHLELHGEGECGQGEFYIVRFRAHQRFIVRPDTGRHRGAAFVGLGDAEIDFGFHLRFSFLSMSAIRSFNRLRSLANSLRNRFSSVRRSMTQRTASKPCFLIAASTSDLALRYFDLSDRFMWCL